MDNFISNLYFSVAYYLQITKKCWLSDANMENVCLCGCDVNYYVISEPQIGNII